MPFFEPGDSSDFTAACETAFREQISVNRHNLSAVASVCMLSIMHGLYCMNLCRFIIIHVAFKKNTYRGKNIVVIVIILNMCLGPPMAMSCVISTFNPEGGHMLTPSRVFYA